jgi:anti-anti-sigma factor
MQDTLTVTVLRLADEILTSESLQFVYQCLDEPGAPIIHLDLGDVRLPTADGLGALVALNKELRERGGALVLFNVNAAIYEVFLLTHLVDVLEVSTTSQS